MSSDNDRPSQLDHARRHFLGAAAAAGAKAAAVGVFAGTLLSSTKLWAWGRNWGKPGHGGGNGGGSGGSRCFLRGTSIQTPSGMSCIEDLRIGDLVNTLNGAAPIKWIGRQTFRKGGAAWHADIKPVLVSRHALGDNVPHADLYLSPHHYLFVDGMLLRAKDLVNGQTIKFVEPAEDAKLEYFNLLLDAHEVVFAEGAAAETFLLEQDNHEAFDNFAELARLYPEPMQHMAPFAERVRCSGRDHVKALMQLAKHPFKPINEPLSDAHARLAARARELAG